jgi:hypothetical protein
MLLAAGGQDFLRQHQLLLFVLPINRHHDRFLSNFDTPQPEFRTFGAHLKRFALGERQVVDQGNSPSPRSPGDPQQAQRARLTDPGFFTPPRTDGSLA